MQCRFKGHLDHLGFAVGVCRKIDNLGSRFALCEIIFLVPRDTCHVEAFHEIRTLLAVAIDHIINGTFVSALEDRYMEYVGTDEDFLRHLQHLVFTILMEDDDIVYVRAVEEELVFLEPRSDESFLAVDIQFLVVLNHRLYIDSSEVAHLSPARVRLAVFLLQHLEPGYRIVGEMVEILDTGFDLLLQVLHQLVRFLGVEFGDTDHADLEEFLDILGADFPDQLRFEGRERFIHIGDELLLVRRILIPLLFIDAVLNKDLLQRGIEIFLLQFAFLNLQFPFQKGFGVIGRKAEQIADGCEDRFSILHHAAVGADIDLAIREGIERVDSFVGRRAGSELHNDTCGIRREIVDLLNLDLAFLRRFEDGLYDFGGCGAVRDFGDDKRLVVVRLLDTCADLDRTTAFAVVVLGDVYHAAGREIRKELELLTAQIGEGSITQLVEVMRQDL